MKKKISDSAGSNSQLLPKEVRKYLDKYFFGKTGTAAADTWHLETGDDVSGICMTVVVPAIMEFENIRKLLLSLASNDPFYFEKTLIIFVVNNLASSSEEIKKDNSLSLNLLRNIIRGYNAGEVEAKVISSGLKLALADASAAGHELPEKDGGVGLARKIGMDLSLTVFDYISPEKKILVCLDSDCTVDSNYITEIYRNFQDRNLSAATVNFSHMIGGRSGHDAEYDYAITCYEIFLRYYVLGLLFAESPYAFHTIGSTMACDYESYIKVEGMNKRKAAEDFYFMEKLAKLVTVSKINSTTVYPSPRTSWRVPFGTGQRVNRHIAKTQNEYVLYSPESFVILKQWHSVYSCPESYDASYYLDKAVEIHPALYEFLLAQDFPADFNRIIRNSKRSEQLLRQKSGWFDGFRTLKLIHYLRDNGFPLRPMFEALDEMFRLKGIDFQISRNQPVPPLEEQLKYLERLRGL